MEVVLASTLLEPERRFLIHEVEEGEEWVIIDPNLQRIGKVQLLSADQYRIFLGKTSGQGRWMRLKYDNLKDAATSLARHHVGKARG